MLSQGIQHMKQCHPLMHGVFVKKLLISMLFLYSPVYLCGSSHMIDPVYLRKSRALSSQQAEERTIINLSHAAPRSIWSSHTMRDVALYHGSKGFAVHEGSEVYAINYHDQDEMSRKINMGNLLGFLNSGGRIFVSRATDGSFLMKASIGAPGGGPILANIMCYGTFLLGGCLPILLPNFVLNSYISRSAILKSYSVYLESLSLQDCQMGHPEAAEWVTSVITLSTSIAGYAVVLNKYPHALSNYYRKLIRIADMAYTKGLLMRFPGDEVTA